jgi:GxxExxY protein
MARNSANIIYRDLSYQIIGAIFEVHKELGPGFLESVYEKALIEEFTKKAVKVETQRLPM